MRLVPFAVAAAFLLLAPRLAHAAGPLAITRVAAYEPSDHEWIEVRNVSDSSIDLTGWKFWEDGVNHGLTAFRGGMTLAAGESAVIADVAATTAADHPEWTGILIDSAWSTLALDGEPIGLRDPSGALWESPEATWLREAPSDATEPPAADAPTPGVGRTPSLGELVLSEVLPAPVSGNEWIELHNTTSSTLALDGLELADAVGRIAALSGTLAADGYLTVTLSSAKLNNGGDEVTLRGLGTLDAMSYGDDALPAPAAGQALARDGDAWLPTTTPTPAAANRISTPAAPAGKKSASIGPDLTLRPGSAVLNEVAPRQPEGDDWLELANRTERRLDLRGWKVLVGADRTIPLAGKVSAGSRMLVRLDADALPDRGILLLVDGSGTTLDQVSYGRYSDGNEGDNAPAPEPGGSLARHEGQDTDVDAEDFFLPSRPTPGRANVAPEDETPQTSSDPLRSVILPTCVLPEEDAVRATAVMAALDAPVSMAAKAAAPAKKLAAASSKKKPAALATTLAALPELAEQTRVRVEATVVGAPTPVTGRVWYLADGEAGAKLQLTGKPIAAAPGDRLRIEGTLAWTSGPLLRATAATVTRLATGASTTPAERGIGTLTADDAHQLVSVAGTAVAVKPGKLTIEDRDGSLPADVPRDAAVRPGESVRLTGIYLNTDTPKLLVLDAAAITMLAAAPPAPPQPAAPGKSPSPWPLVGALTTLAASGWLLVRRKRTDATGPPPAEPPLSESTFA